MIYSDVMKFFNFKIFIIFIIQFIIKICNGAAENHQDHKICLYYSLIFFLIYKS